MYFMYSSSKKKKTQEQRVIKISKFISLRRSPAFWGSSQDGGRRCYSRKVLTCLLAETWDNLVCGNGNGVDQGTSNGVTAKFICCSLHLLAPKQLSGLQRSTAKTETAHSQLACLCLSYIMFFWKPSKLSPISHFLAHLVGFSWYIMILWFSIFPLSGLEYILLRCWFPLITKVSDKGGRWNHSFYYQAQYYISHPHFEEDKDSMTVCQNPSRFHFRQGCQDN